MDGLLHPWHFGLLLSGRTGTLWKCWKTLIGSRVEKQVSHRFTGVFHIPTEHSSSLCGAGAHPVAAGLLPAPEPAEECQAIYFCRWRFAPKNNTLNEEQKRSTDPFFRPCRTACP